MDPAESLRRHQSQIADAVAAALAAARVPGGVLGISTGGKSWFVADGVVSVDEPNPVSSSTPFMLGSITKVFTGLAVMRLAAENRIDLGDSLAMHLPELAAATDSRLLDVTIAQALNHSSGIDGDVMIDTGEGPDSLATYVERLSAMPLLHRSGAMFSYSNAAYCVLGHLIESIVGDSYTAVVEALSRQIGAEAVIDIGQLERGAQGHRLADGRPTTTTQRLPASMRPAGAATWMTPEALIELGRAVLRATVNSQVTLSPMQSVTRMIQPTIALPALNAMAASMGLTFFLDQWSGHLVISHAGGTAGHAANLVVIPDLDLVMCLMTNCMGAAAWPAIRDAVFAAALGLEPRALPEPSPNAHVADINRSAYEGTYQRHGQLLVVDAPAGTDTLTLTRGTTSRTTSTLHALDGERFLDVSEVGPPGAVTFATFQHGRPQHLYVSVRVACRG